MKHLAYITLLIESENEDDFESKTDDIFGDTTWSQLNHLLNPSYQIRGFVAKTPIRYEEDVSQKKKVKATKDAYEEHISELKNYDF